MSNEIDDKTKVAVLRELAAKYDPDTVAGRVLRDELKIVYPWPKPKSGRLCEFVFPDGMKKAGYYYDHRLYEFHERAGSFIDLTSEEGTLYPVQTFGPTQVAVDVDNPRGGDWPEGAARLSIGKRWWDADDVPVVSEGVITITRAEAHQMYAEAEHGSW